MARRVAGGDVERMFEMLADDPLFLLLLTGCTANAAHELQEPDRAVGNTFRSRKTITRP